MKFNKWEVKGVPLRLEFGPKDLHNNTIVFVRRAMQFNGDQVISGLHPFKTKEVISLDNITVEFITKYLDTIQNDMLEKAKNRLKACIVYCRTNEEIINVLENKKLALIDWEDKFDDAGYEATLKLMCKKHEINSTKVLCIPNRSTLENLGVQFDASDQKSLALFGRSY
jgi:prolyl-tRNA synthetase